MHLQNQRLNVVLPKANLQLRPQQRRQKCWRRKSLLDCSRSRARCPSINVMICVWKGWPNGSKLGRYCFNSETRPGIYGQVRSWTYFRQWFVVMVSRRKICIREMQRSVVNIRFLADCRRMHLNARSSYIQTQKTREYNSATINPLS